MQNNNKGKFDGWLFYSDFDGTVYSEAITVEEKPKSKISQENIDAIRYFQANGGRFAFASGRFVSMICETVPEIKLNAPVISVNGAILASPDDFSEIRRGTIDTAPMFEYMYDLYKTDDGVVGGHFYGADNNSYHFSALYGDEPDHDAFLAAMPDACLKMIILVKDEDSERVTELIREQLGDRYHVSRSWINGIEIVDKAFSKGQAALFAKKYVGAKHLVCVGDYENDLDMIEVADIGYAVANAIPSVKAVADRITVSVHEHALAAIVRELEAEIDASEK